MLNFEQLTILVPLAEIIAVELLLTTEGYI